MKVPGKRKAEPSPGVALLMGMGTGKTLCIVSLLNLIRPRKTLILCPTSVVGVWPRELATHSEGVFGMEALRNAERKTPMSVAQKTKKLLEFWDEDPAPNEIGKIVVLNYESAWREPMREELLSHRWDLVILDEMHKIKSPTGKASKFCWDLANTAERRIGLTGTEQPHSPLDVFSQYKFLNSKVFGGTFYGFKKRYTISNQWNKVVKFINMEDMKSKIDSIAFRAGEEVLDLPEAMHINVETEITGEARKLHETILEGMWAELEERSEEGASEAVLASVVVAQLTRCAQVTGGFVGGVMDLDNPEAEPEVRRIKGASKKDALEDIVSGIDFDAIRSDGTKEKLVVFARFRDDLDQIEEVAVKNKRSYGEISGRSKSGLTKDSELNSEFEIIGVQLQAGGVGIDLTAARYVVYWSKDFNLGNIEQSLKRCHRPGQKFPVTFYHFVAPETIDQRIEESLESKQSVVEFFRKKFKDREKEKI